jgi:hypothetical protein
MERLIYDGIKKRFELWLVQEASADDVTKDFDFISLLVGGTLKEIIVHKTIEMTRGVIIERTKAVACRREIEGFIYISPIIKSASGKSVSQYFYNRKTSSREIFNLPQRFRDIGFDSGVAIRRGPFTKKKFGDKLVDVNSWYLNEIFFVGTSFQCLCKIAEIVLDSLIVNLEFSPTSLKEFEYVQNEVGKVEGDSLIIEIETVISSLIAEFEDFDRDGKLNNSDCWMQLAEEEERSMDEDSNGWWRWNID